MNTRTKTRLKNLLKQSNALISAVLLSASISNYAVAQGAEKAAEASPATDVKALNIQKLQEKLGLQVLEFDATSWPGMFVVMTDRGVFYTNSDASMLLQGNLFDITDMPVNETDKFKARYLTKALPRLKDKWIEFTAPEQKHVLYVYTSPSCGYCRKLHNEIDDYLNAGVTIRYLAMPRAGAQSAEFKNMSNTWCNNHSVETFDRMMSGETIAENAQCNTSLEPHLVLAQNLGISSTPAIIRESGEIQMGYRPWKEMIDTLK